MNITDSSEEWQDGLTSNTICIISIWKWISSLVFFALRLQWRIRKLYNECYGVDNNIRHVIIGRCRFIVNYTIVIIDKISTFEWQILCQFVAHGKDEYFSTHLAGRNKTISPFQGPLLRIEISRKSEIWAWIDHFIHIVLSFSFVNHVLTSIVV